MAFSLAETDALGFSPLMQKTVSYIAAASILLIAAAHAELPTLPEKPWLGYFLGIADRSFQFGIETKGPAILLPLKRKGEPVNIHNPIKIRFEVLETMPDGKVVSKQIKPESLASTSPAVEDPEQPIIITGKVTGDAAFSVAITPDRGSFSITGKITDKGTLSNPISFVVSAAFNPYDGGGGATDEKQEAFEKKIKRDEVKIILVAGKKEKLEFAEKKNPAILFKEGMSSVEIESASYEGVTFEFTATDQSKIVFEDKGEQALWDAFTLVWTVNADADPDTQKLTIAGK